MPPAAERRRQQPLSYPGERVRREPGARGERPRRRGASRARRSGALFACFLVAAAIVGSVSLASIFLHVVVVQNEVRVRELQKELEQEKRIQERLRAEISSLESPARLEKAAVEELKMVQATRAEYLEVPRGAVAKPEGTLKESEEQARLPQDSAGGN